MASQAMQDEAPEPVWDPKHSATRIELVESHLPNDDGSHEVSATLVYDVGHGGPREGRLTITYLPEGTTDTARTIEMTGAQIDALATVLKDLKAARDGLHPALMDAARATAA